MDDSRTVPRRTRLQPSMSEGGNQSSTSSSADMGSNQFVRRHHMSNNNPNGGEELEKAQGSWDREYGSGKEKDPALYTPGEYNHEHQDPNASLVTTVLQWSRKNCFAWDSTTMILLWVVFFYVSSVMANIMNKQLVDDHHASPTMLTFWHIAYALAIDWFIVQRQQPREHAKRPVGFWNIFRVYAPLSVFIVLGKFSTYLSFGYVSMSLTHTAKASEPIFNVLLAALLFGEVRPFTVNVSLIPIAAGVAIASISEISYNHFGFLAATTSAMAKVLQNIYTKRVMDSEHFTFFELHMWCAIASLIIMIPLIVYQFFFVAFTTDTLQLAMPFFVCSTVQYLSSLSSYMLLSLVTHLSFTIVNTMKRLVLISSGMFYFGLWNVQSFLGVCLAVSGVFCYNMAKMKHDKSHKAVYAAATPEKEATSPKTPSSAEEGSLLDPDDDRDEETQDRTSSLDP
eukprot:gb/GECG01008926.1/.p1 GENE.gb/GECG01008926.1/~~gb/GECG01008926.1/.p1  ORF type:complete len:454 (+),score=48.95 gb/GECG01008926.1/:1-1362(+)